MLFPLEFYNPLRPQTTIAIDQVKSTSSETQPSVKISIAVRLDITKSFLDLSYSYLG